MDTMKKCPYCSEDIQASAIKCRYCGEWFERPAQSVQPESDFLSGGAWAAGPSRSVLEPSPPDVSSGVPPPLAEPASPNSSQHTNSLAVGALVAGILVFLFGAFAGIPAFLMGRAAQKQIAASSGAETGRGMATAGIALGAFSIALTIVAAVFFFGRGADRPELAAGLTAADERALIQQNCQAMHSYVAASNASGVFNPDASDVINAPTDNSTIQGPLEDVAAQRAWEAVGFFAGRWTGNAMALDGGRELVAGWEENLAQLYDSATAACVAIDVPAP